MMGLMTQKVPLERESRAEVLRELARNHRRQFESERAAARALLFRAGRSDVLSDEEMEELGLRFEKMLLSSEQAFQTLDKLEDFLQDRRDHPHDPLSPREIWRQAWKDYRFDRGGLYDFLAFGRARELARTFLIEEGSEPTDENVAKRLGFSSLQEAQRQASRQRPEIQEQTVTIPETVLSLIEKRHRVRNALHGRDLKTAADIGKILSKDSWLAQKVRDLIAASGLHEVERETGIPSQLLTEYFKSHQCGNRAQYVAHLDSILKRR